MRFLLLAFLLCACASNPIDTPKTQHELDLWMEAESMLAGEERKAKTLWMYSTGSFALFAIGLAIIAFSPVRRFSGLVFVAGGVAGMASVWVFDSLWFPWVAGGTVGVIVLSALAFAWVRLYEAYISPSKPRAEPREKR